MMLRPAKLQKGDRIGVIAPAGPVAEEDIQPSLDLLTSAGFQIRLGPHLFHVDDYMAGKDTDRLQDLHDMFQDPEVSAVFCARGGYGTLRLLEHLDYEMIRGNPKIILGYSDATALLLAIHKRCSMITFHGPMVRELVTKNRSNWDGLLGLLTGNGLKIRFPLGSAIREGRTVGPLIGGNTSLVCHLLGTPFLPSLGGCILFLEELGEPLYRVDRMITHLRLSGQLHGLAGVVTGQFKECGDPKRIDRLLKERLGDLGIPAATGLPVGHGNQNMTVPIGVPAELDTKRMTLTLTEPCVGP